MSFGNSWPVIFTSISLISHVYIFQREIETQNVSENVNNKIPYGQFII